MSMEFNRKHQWNKTPKGKKVQEDIYLIYTTSCREVKGREMVKEKIKRVNIRGSSPRNNLERESSPIESYPLSKGERESNHRNRKQREFICMKIGGSSPRIV
jgi:hypothetical protein